MTDALADFYNPQTMCTGCHYAINGLNRWWCSTHRHVIRQGDETCPQFKGRGTIGRGVVPLKSKEQVALEQSKLIDYVPKNFIKAQQAKKDNTKTTTSRKKR